MVQVFALALIMVLGSFKTTSNLNYPYSKVSIGDSTVTISSMSHYINGSSSTLSYINSLGESNIPYGVMDETGTHAYWFTSYAELESWLDGKDYKNSLLADIAAMDSIGGESCEECDDLVHKFKNKRAKSFYRPKVIGATVWAYAFENANGSGESHTYTPFAKKTLGSFNNKASLVGVGGPTLLGSVVFCSQQKFKGTKLYVLQSPPFSKYKDLNGHFMNDNIESVF